MHPNTIRFYEEMGLLPAVQRTESGYRIFNDRHLKQLQLLRTAFLAEIISSNLRHEVFGIIKAAAAGDVEGAYQDTWQYLKKLEKEKDSAEEAILIVQEIVAKDDAGDERAEYTCRKEMAEALGITADVLRNWERNGLVQVRSNSKGWRKYGSNEINRLKIIRTLRNAHYSMMSILRMLKQLDEGQADLGKIINTPDEDEDIVCAADRYVSALRLAEKDALEMIDMLDEIRKENEALGSVTIKSDSL